MWLGKLLLVVCVLLVLSFQVVYSQQWPPTVKARVDTEVSLTIEVPNEDESIIVKLNTSLALPLKSILFIYPTLGFQSYDYIKNESTVKRDSTQNIITITFPNVKAKFGGKYDCYLQTTSKLIPECGQLLVVIRTPNPPEVQVLSPAKQVVGKDLLLECKPNSTSVPSYYHLSSMIWWTYDGGQPITATQNNERIYMNTDGNLVVTNLQRSDKGLSFKCKTADDADSNISDLISPPSSIFVLNPEFKPLRKDMTVYPFFKDKSTMSFKRNSEVRFKCTVNCQPKCDVSWKFKALNRDMYFDIQTGDDGPSELLIPNVQIQQQGSYKCVGKNDNGQTQITFNLVVLYLHPPILSVNGMDTKHFTTDEGDGDVVVKCVVDSNPAPVISWFGPGDKPLAASETEGPLTNLNSDVIEYNYTSSIILQNLKCEDQGKYSCKSTSSLNISATQAIQIYVRCKPVSVTSGHFKLRKDYVWDLSHPLSIPFVIRAWPTPNVTKVISTLNGVTRQENDVKVNSESSYNRSVCLTKFNMHIGQELTEADSGRLFTVELENSGFESKLQFIIRPRGKPDPVTNITAFDISHDSLHVSWSPGFNGGEPQMFTVMHKLVAANVDPSRRPWATVTTNIPSGSKNPSVKVHSLHAESQYVIAVVAANALGNTTEEIFITTTAAPSAGSNAGTIAGVCFGILIIIMVFLYFLYRWKCHKDDSRVPIVPEVLTSFCNFQKCKGKGSEESSNKMARLRKVFHFRKKSGKGKDSYEEPDDVPIATDPLTKKDISGPMNNNGNNMNGEGRSVNKDGLIYTQIEIVNNGRKNKKVKICEPGKDDSAVQYEELDFDKMKTINEEKKRREQYDEEAEDEKVEIGEEEDNGDQFHDANVGPGTTV